MTLFPEAPSALCSNCREMMAAPASARVAHLGHSGPCAVDSTSAPPAKKKTSKRRENDRYLTPPMATTALIERFPGLQGELLIDPCCGDGRMAKQLRGRFRGQLLNDIDPASPASWHLDATRAATWQRWLEFGIGTVITNPTFAGASAIADHALNAGHLLALLLRLTWLEATKGRQWLARRPPTSILVLPRIDFIGAGRTDSATYAWMIWADGIVPPGVKIVRAEEVSQQRLELGAL